MILGEFMRLHLSASATSLLALSVALSGLAVAQPAIAQPAGSEAAAEADVVIVTGTRRTARSAADTPAPVDVIGGAEISAQADTDMSNLVRNVVPSFNVNTQAISDAATIVRPANLRGLAPDHTLVLVNGKRRNRSAIIAFIGGGISNGAQGVDISQIPAIGIKRVEVLRDGAAAQYGSDAIAGVMNFILRDDPDSFEVQAKYGSTFEGDGTNYALGGNFGLALTENGFANLSVEFRQADPTSRSVQRGDAAALAAAGNTAIRNPAQIWGQPEVSGDIRAFLNTGIELSDTRSVYAFGSYATRETLGGFYFRNPNTRGGVFSNDGGVTRLVGDLTPNDGQACPTITIGAPNEAALITQVRNNPNCFIWNEVFPGGFTPQFGGELTSFALAGGLRDTIGNLSYDVSLSRGTEEVVFKIQNTINSSLGPNSPTTFNPGAQSQTETNFNVDLAYELAVSGFASPLNVAGGFEWRKEEFQLNTGDAASFAVGPLATQGFSLGSNGFNGFTPIAAGRWERTNTAFYLDLEADVTERVTLGAAVRTEDFDTFGRTTNYKLSGLVRATDALTFRGTYSTGFRAPTPGQANIVNTTTRIIGGNLANIGTIPPDSVLGLLLGGRELEPETSKNLSLGFGLDLGAFTLTVDYFNIDMEDRLTQASGRTLTQAQVNALPASQIRALEEYGVVVNGQLTSDTSNFTFFTNDFNTQTSGLDVVAAYTFDALGGSNRLALVYNRTETELASPSALLSESVVKQIEDGLPKDRANVSWTYNAGRFGSLVRLNYFGSYYEDHVDSGAVRVADGGLPIFEGSAVTVDLEVNFDLTDSVNLAVGLENAFDRYPERNPWADVVGAQYPVTSPYGFQGGAYYIRLRYAR
jgi:iron complex outermembrane recepter protein